MRAVQFPEPVSFLPRRIDHRTNPAFYYRIEAAVLKSLRNEQMLNKVRYELARQELENKYYDL